MMTRHPSRRTLAIGAALAVAALSAALMFAPDSGPHQTSGETNYVASVNSEVFHVPTCRYVRRIHEDNMETFTSYEEAERYGHRPCKVCRP